MLSSSKGVGSAKRTPEARSPSSAVRVLRSAIKIHNSSADSTGKKKRELESSFNFKTDTNKNNQQPSHGANRGIIVCSQERENGVVSATERGVGFCTPPQKPLMPYAEPNRAVEHPILLKDSPADNNRELEAVNRVGCVDANYMFPTGPGGSLSALSFLSPRPRSLSCQSTTTRPRGLNKMKANGKPALEIRAEMLSNIYNVNDRKKPVHKMDTSRLSICDSSAESSSTVSIPTLSQPPLLQTNTNGVSEASNTVQATPRALSQLQPDYVDVAVGPSDPLPAYSCEEHSVNNQQITARQWRLAREEVRNLEEQNSILASQLDALRVAEVELHDKNKGLEKNLSSQTQLFKELEVTLSSERETRLTLENKMRELEDERVIFLREKETHASGAAVDEARLDTLRAQIDSVICERNALHKLLLSAEQNSTAEIQRVRENSRREFEKLLETRKGEYEAALQYRIDEAALLKTESERAKKALAAAKTAQDTAERAAATANSRLKLLMEQHNVQGDRMRRREAQVKTLKGEVEKLRTEAHTAIRTVSDCGLNDAVLSLRRDLQELTGILHSGVTVTCTLMNKYEVPVSTNEKSTFDPLNNDILLSLERLSVSTRRKAPEGSSETLLDAINFVTRGAVADARGAAEAGNHIRTLSKTLISHVKRLCSALDSAEAAIEHRDVVAEKITLAVEDAKKGHTEEVSALRAVLAEREREIELAQMEIRETVDTAAAAAEQIKSMVAEKNALSREIHELRALCNERDGEQESKSREEELARKRASAARDKRARRVTDENTVLRQELLETREQLEKKRVFAEQLLVQLDRERRAAAKKTETKHSFVDLQSQKKKKRTSPLARAAQRMAARARTRRLLAHIKLQERKCSEAEVQHLLDVTSAANLRSGCEALLGAAKDACSSLKEITNNCEKLMAIYHSSRMAPYELPQLSVNVAEGVSVPEECDCREDSLKEPEDASARMALSARKCASLLKRECVSAEKALERLNYSRLLPKDDSVMLAVTHNGLCSSNTPASAALLKYVNNAERAGFRMSGNGNSDGFMRTKPGSTPLNSQRCELQKLLKIEDFSPSPEATCCSPGGLSPSPTAEKNIFGFYEPIVLKGFNQNVTDSPQESLLDGNDVTPRRPPSLRQKTN